MKSAIALSLLVLTSLTLTLAAATPEPRPGEGGKSIEGGKSLSAARFEGLKRLAGDWVEVAKDGKPTRTIVSSIRVTAGGTAVEETFMPGTDHEMVTLYHLDGPDLVLTHYCVLGNQPRMKADATGDPKRIVFRFVGASNLASENDSHMRQATLHLAGPDRYQSEWVGCKDGADCHKVNFDLVRKHN